MFVDEISSTQQLIGLNKIENNDDQNVFLEMLSNTNASVNEAKELATNMALGESIPTHEVIIASEKAKLELQLLIEVRNKLLEGYQEIMRMQV